MKTGHRRSPHQAFTQDLQAFILQCQHLNEAIILVGDFNTDISDSSSGMHELAETCGLVDLFAVRLGESNIPATYQRGTKRIDYALLSPQLIQHIKAAGYEPFGYRVPSDHRGMYIDLSTTALFQQHNLPLAPSSQQDFFSKSPGIVNHVSAKMKYLQDHRFFRRLDELISQEVPNNELAEALDRDFQRAAHHAAKCCARKPRPPWSPKLAMIWATLHFYRLSRSAVRTTANYLPAIQKLQDKWHHLPREIPTDLRETATHYKETIQNLKAAQSQARNLRNEYLLQKAEAYHINNDTSSANALQRLLRAETQQQVFQKLPYIRNQNNPTSGLSQLKIPIGHSPTETETMKNLPDTPEYWETITCPKRIEDILLQQNRHHFGQANETPFATPPLQMEVGYKADGIAVDTILSGNVQLAAVPVVARLLIRHLKQRTTTTIPGSITVEQITKKLKVWKETTTTSPSGIHLGHYHCLWRSPTSTGDTKKDEQIKKQQKLLLQATEQLMNYALFAMDTPMNAGQR